MSKYSDKIDKIYDDVGDIRVDVSSINAHLKTLNGKVIDNVNRIYNLEVDNTKNKLLWAKVGGMAAVIGAVIGGLFGLVVRIG